MYTYICIKIFKKKWAFLFSAKNRKITEIQFQFWLKNPLWSILSNNHLEKIFVNNLHVLIYF